MIQAAHYGNYFKAQLALPPYQHSLLLPACQYSSAPVLLRHCAMCRACKVVVSLGDSWSSNGLHYQVVNLYISSLTTTTIAVPWELQVTNPAYTSLSQVINPLQMLMSCAWINDFNLPSPSLRALVSMICPCYGHILSGLWLQHLCVQPLTR